MITHIKSVTLIAALSCSVSAYADPIAIPFTDSQIVIDGLLDEAIWHSSPTLPLDQPIIGGEPETADFSGTYQLAWDANYVYLAARIRDDVLFDQHPDPLHFYWDDDCLEIFIDEDASGGDHLNNYNAFAYHVALDGNVADIGEQQEGGQTNFVLLNNHVKSRWQRDIKEPTLINWEIAIEIHNDHFSPTALASTSRVELSKGKIIGFMLAYCDNDGSQYREHFIGSHFIAPVDGDQNLGYKDASVFGKIKLAKPNLIN